MNADLDKSMDRLSLENTVALECGAKKNMLSHYRSTGRVDIYEQRYYHYLQEYNSLRRLREGEE